MRENVYMHMWLYTLKLSDVGLSHVTLFKYIKCASFIFLGKRRDILKEDIFSTFISYEMFYKWFTCRVNDLAMYFSQVIRPGCILGADLDQCVVRSTEVSLGFSVKCPLSGAVAFSF